MHTILCPRFLCPCLPVSGCMYLEQPAASDLCHWTECNLFQFPAPSQNAPPVCCSFPGFLPRRW